MAGLIGALAVGGLASCASVPASPPLPPIVPLAHGPRELSDDEQIAQVMNRLTFGPRPGDFERIKQIGVDRWVGEQLVPARIDDNVPAELIASYPAEFTSDSTLVATWHYPELLRKANPLMPDSIALRQAYQARGRIVRDVINARMTRAIMSQRQLQEVMTDFWENHFSVYAGKGDLPQWIPSYDRQIRAHALGRFRDLLGVVAHSPAMLYYLDNWESRADSGYVTLGDLQGEAKAQRAYEEYEIKRRRVVVDPYGRVVATGATLRPPAPYRPPARRGRGLNENYGRELLELHTVGVNGGYTQQDVIDAARILTGWTIHDIAHDGRFQFRADMHDATPKVVLGHRFAGGRGQDEGEELLDFLARQPATARFIAYKLARRFVSDTPSVELVRSAAETFLQTDGDISAVLRTIIASPEFFSRAAYRAKVKSPVEFLASTFRALGGHADTAYAFNVVLTQLGEPVFGHIAPDGYPETGDAWINTGAILSRINFGVAVASDRVRGVSVAAWPIARDVTATPRAQQVTTVIRTILEGTASPETARVLEEGTTSTTGGPPPGNASSLAQVVGLALGTPEFQRR